MLQVAEAARGLEWTEVDLYEPESNGLGGWGSRVPGVVGRHTSFPVDRIDLRLRGFSVLQVTLAIRSTRGPQPL